jgi:hypothetical protein
MAGGFTTEVEGLENAADNALRPLAEELRAARARITATSEFDEAFSAGDGNAESLDLAARALREIAARYRAADGESAKAMNSIAREGLS